MAQNCSGSSQQYNTWRFTTIDYPVSAPQLIFPVNNDTVTKEVVLKWHSVANAVNYSVYISRTPNESGIVYKGMVRDTTMYASLLESGRYYWWVKAINVCNTESEMSQIGSFYFILPFKLKEPVLSDIKYKTNISNIDSAMYIINNLNPVYFYWNVAEYPELKEGNRQIGLIAQYVQSYVPEVIKVNEKGDYAIDYSRLVPLLISAIKEQENKIAALRAEVNGLSQYLYNVCCPPNEKIQQNITPQFTKNITLTNRKAIVLNQNQPNPFKEQTIITFQIPEYVVNAKIVFTDIYGNILAEVEIKERGYGELVVYAQDLSSGNYLYYLIADNKIIETRKMTVK
ncbi:MAG: tail fiber domain-containing protein [Bacteroidales bacterium]|nr:tail fiber domain-containing protein [Bacteroidales bacterium]